MQLRSWYTKRGGKSDLQVPQNHKGQTKRDYGRIGLFAMHDGKLPDGTQVLAAAVAD